MNGCEERRRGEFISTQGNSSHSVCASARYRHRAREFAFFAPSLSTLFIGAKKTHSFLRFIHGTGAQCAHLASAARQSVFGRRVSLHHSHSLSSPSPIQRRLPLSLPPIQCNTLQSNPPLLFSPSHCCAGPVHDVILGNSTSLRFKEVA